MYQAPEIILLGDCCNKVDIWALGCTLYELLTGQLLFDPDGDEETETDFNHLYMIQDMFGNLDKNNISKYELYTKYYRKGYLRNYDKSPVNLHEKLKENLKRKLLRKKFRSGI